MPSLPVFRVRAEVLLLSFGGSEEDSPQRGWGGVGVRAGTMRGPWSSREHGDKLRREKRRWAGTGAQHSGEDKASGQAGWESLRDVPIMQPLGQARADLEFTCLHQLK